MHVGPGQPEAAFGTTERLLGDVRCNFCGPVRRAVRRCGLTRSMQGAKVVVRNVRRSSRCRQRILPRVRRRIRRRQSRSLQRRGLRRRLRKCRLNRRALRFRSRLQKLFQRQLRSRQNRFRRQSRIRPCRSWLASVAGECCRRRANRRLMQSQVHRPIQSSIQTPRIIRRPPIPHSPPWATTSVTPATPTSFLASWIRRRRRPTRQAHFLPVHRSRPLAARFRPAIGQRRRARRRRTRN